MLEGNEISEENEFLLAHRTDRGIKNHGDKKLWNGEIDKILLYHFHGLVCTLDGGNKIVTM